MRKLAFANGQKDSPASNGGVQDRASYTASGSRCSGEYTLSQRLAQLVAKADLHSCTRRLPTLPGSCAHGKKEEIFWR
jgi:hypothetical protein